MRAAARITRAATVKPRVARTLATAASTRPEVVILSATRTPIGSFNGALASFTGPQLGTIVIKDALRKANVKPDQVDEAILGCVLSAGAGQAPARQAVLKAGLPPSVVCTTINKVCASGLKAVSLAAQSLSTGASQRVVVAGGFESMSNVPYYVPKARQGLGYGHAQLVDGVLHDGLWDATDNHHMGSCAEICSVEYKIGREEQDKYAIESYRRAQVATKSGLFKEEITPVPLPPKRGSKESKDMTEDEEPFKVDNAKVPTLKPAFKKEGGTVTAANASALNDGAAALLLSTREYADANGLKPLARVLGFADAETKPVHFTIAPSLAVPKALANAGVSAKDVDYWEINEAFSVVALANMGLLKIDADRININGGAVALGHPIGGSGARIITTLLHVLRQKKARIGVASICNGGGGATAVVVENLQL